VRIAQQRRPGPNGPYVLVARGEKDAEGKSPVLGQFSVDKKDYEVIQWLSKTNRDARYKIEFDHDEEPGMTGEPPKAHVASVYLQNESKHFVAVDWKKCRDEFETANKTVQLPQQREAQKSAVIESQIATPTLPGSTAVAPPKREDLNQGPLPLPRLRPVSVPKAPTPAFGGRGIAA
jgi:hypothetical protein